MPCKVSGGLPSACGGLWKPWYGTEPLKLKAGQELEIIQLELLFVDIVASRVSCKNTSQADGCV